MRAQHYKLEIVPRKFFGAVVPDALPVEIMEEGLVAWGPVRQPDEDFLAKLRPLFSRDTSWEGMEELRTASLSGSCLGIWKENGLVEYISLGYSPADDDWDFFRGVIAVVAAHDCLFVETSTGVVLEADEGILRAGLNRAVMQHSLTDLDGAMERAPGSIGTTQVQPEALQADGIDPFTGKRKMSDDDFLGAIVCFLAFVVWLPVYLIFVRPELNWHLAGIGITGYPMVLHLVPIIGVPTLLAYAILRLARSGKRSA